MAPKAAPAAATISPSAGGMGSDDSASPPGPDSVHGRQQMFMQALEEASTEQDKSRGADADKDVFPYSISVPFKVRDVVPGNKCASARVFLAEAPITVLKDMCFYLELEEDGSIDDLVARVVDYFIQLYPDRVKAAKASKVIQDKLASGPTPVRVRKQSSGSVDVAQPLNADSRQSDFKARLTELGKPIYGSNVVLWKRLQEAEAELATQKEEPAAARKKRQKEEPAAEEDDEDKPSKKAKVAKPTEKEPPKVAKPTEKLQKQYCVAGLSIAAQMKLAMKMSMES